MADARILLVEDDDLNQRLVRTVLARSGDPVLRSAYLIQAASLAEARAAGSGGPAVVALTGAAPEQGSAALAAGCIAVLGKPYKAAQLCALVRAALSS
jgi:CheY-like chemotaxis protein